MVLTNEADGHESKFIKKIVREPGERSRLWHHKDSFKVLTENNGTKTIEGLVLNMQMHPAFTTTRTSSKVVLEADAFTRMHKLRLLQLSHVQLTGCYKEFPTGLRWMCWLKYPLPSIPSDFPLQSLVVLEMCHSSLRQVWTGTKYLPSMKVLNLSHSHDLNESLGIIMMQTGYWYMRQWQGMYPVQGLYQRGIFSTFLPGNEVPGRFSHTSRGSSVSFTVPLLPELNTRGLNVFTVLAKANNNDSDPIINDINIDGSGHPILTVVSNEKKGLNWIYGPAFYSVPVEGQDAIWLSHWKFGTRYLEGGDKVTYSIFTTSEFKVMKCGIQLVYNEQEEKIISTQLNPTDNPFYPDIIEVVPGTYLLFCTEFSNLRRHPWLNNLMLRQFGKHENKLDNNGYLSFVNSDEITGAVPRQKEVQQGDNTLAAESGSNINTCGCRAWKVVMKAAVFFFTVLPLVVALMSFIFQREKQQATILIPT
ncbi:hypothetical protein M0R45_010046 [Rubus argutus]|uniref:Uncharacterized protein n=1 Tax=Rubus argutus TaxID=59490 RepID=A0AAW1Y5X9_RUBAR